MKHPFYLTIVAIAMLLSFNACNKKTPDVPVDADLQAAFIYKQGSYWIYKDTISSEIDSFYVTAISYSVINNYNLIGMVQHNINATTSNNSGGLGFVLKQNNISINYTDSSGLYNYVYDPIPYPFNNGYTVYGDTVNILSSYSIAGNTFDNVTIFHFPITEDDYFYINSSIGVIQMCFNHAGDPLRVWELQRWNIVK